MTGTPKTTSLFSPSPVSWLSFQEFSGREFWDWFLESSNIIFRYPKGLPRDAIKVGDELLKFLVGKGEHIAKPADVERIAQQTLVRGKYKMQDAETKS